MMKRFKCLPSPNSMTGVALLGACVQAAVARLPHRTIAVSSRAIADAAVELYEELDAVLDAENNEAVSA